MLNELELLQKKIKYLDIIRQAAIELWAAIPDELCDGALLEQTIKFVDALNEYDYEFNCKNV